MPQKAGIVLLYHLFIIPLQQLEQKQLMKDRKYPLGIQTFENIIKGNYVYIDKTALVYELAHENKYCFLSRPRRFGKSLLVTTLQAYFEGRKELFKGLAIEQQEREWTPYSVIHLDISKGKFYDLDSLHATLNSLLAGYESIYSLAVEYPMAYNVRLQNIIEAAYAKTGKDVVVLIDEYDAPMHDSMKNRELQKQIRDIMRNLISPLKGEEKYLRFVFLTGISKFSQLSIFSELNNITNVSMHDKYSDICGVSEEELLRCLKNDILELAKANDMTYEEALAELKHHYDGYHFSGRGKDMYNPYSLFCTLDNNDFSDYWFSTGTPTFLIELLKEKHLDMLDLDDITATADRFDTPTESITDPVPVLYQSGYLTIKGYNRRSKVYKLGFPNSEVKQGFSNSLFRYYAPDYMRERDALYVAYYDCLVENDNMDAFIFHLQTFYKKFPYTLVNNNERHYQAVLYTCLLMVGADVRAEVPTADGRIDMVLFTKKSIYILELKYEQNAATAMEQINNKDYAAAFADDKRRVYKVGINFSADRRSIESWRIE